METIANFFTDYFIPIIDISIVAILIYSLYNLIAGTRAVQTLKGILIIVVAFFLAQLLELNTFLWLFSKGLEVVAIALIVIFQNELRRIVMKLGENTPIIGSFFERGEHEILQILPQAVYNLSKMKIGALIVIARKTGLKGIIERGVKLDAIITKELVESIFLPKNPLHDGAAIILEDRIAAAACLLPLTERTDLEKVFGTRHRAALGLAEETDAVIIAVSEENGSISIAHDKNLYYNLSKPNFETKLSRCLFKTTDAPIDLNTQKIQQLIQTIKNKITNLQVWFYAKLKKRSPRAPQKDSSSEKSDKESFTKVSNGKK